MIHAAAEKVWERGTSRLSKKRLLDTEVWQAPAEIRASSAKSYIEKGERPHRHKQTISVNIISSLTWMTCSYASWSLRQWKSMGHWKLMPYTLINKTELHTSINRSIFMHMLWFLTLMHPDILASLRCKVNNSQVTQHISNCTATIITPFDHALGYIQFY